MSLNYPRLRTYAEAAAYEQQVKPIRGRPNPEYQRPLCRNRTGAWGMSSWIKIWKTEEAICIGSLNWTNDTVTPWITFHPNGDVQLHPPVWASSSNASLQQNLYWMLGISYVYRHGYGWLRAYAKGAQRATPFRLSRSETVTLRARTAGAWEVKSIDKARWPTGDYVIHTVNRKQANKVRLRHRDAIVVALKLLDLADYSQMSTQPMAELKLDGWYSAKAIWNEVPVLQTLHNMLSGHQYTGKRNFYVGGDQTHKTIPYPGYAALRAEGLRLLSLKQNHRLCLFLLACDGVNEASAKRLLNKLLFFLHREEVFDRTVVNGEIKQDKWRKMWLK